MADSQVKWALDILDDEGMETVPFWRHYGATFGSALCGFGCFAYANLINHRPYYARGPQLIGATIFGAFFGTFMRDYLGYKSAEKEAVLKDYLLKHPNLFPEPERKKYSDPCVISHWAIRR